MFQYEGGKTGLESQEFQENTETLDSLKEEGKNLNLRNIPEEDLKTFVEAANKEVHDEIFQNAQTARNKIEFALNVGLTNVPDDDPEASFEETHNKHIFQNDSKYVGLEASYSIPKTGLTASASVLQFGPETLFGGSLSHDKTGLTAFVSQEYGNMGIDKSFALPKTNITGTVGIATDLDNVSKPYVIGSLDIPINDNLSVGGYAEMGRGYWEVYVQKQIKENINFSVAYVSGGITNVNLSISF